MCILNSEGCNIFKNLTGKVMYLYRLFELFPNPNIIIIAISIIIILLLLLLLLYLLLLLLLLLLLFIVIIIIIIAIDVRVLMVLCQLGHMRTRGLETNLQETSALTRT